MMRLSGLVAIALVAFATQAEAETQLERGGYLVNVLAACAGCHTPKTPSGPGPTLSGGAKFGPPDSAVFAPNITPDRATGIGAWSDGQIIDAIRSGVRPDGSRIGPPMPQLAYHAITNADARAIVAYLRSVPPVSHAVPRSVHKPTKPIAATTTIEPSTPNSDRVAQGRYLAIALSHCTECHTPIPLSAPDVAAHLDEGGRLFRTPKGTIVAPRIRPQDPKRFSDAQLIAIITEGMKPDGSRIEGPMPFRSYAGYRSADLDALLAFLRSGGA